MSSYIQLAELIGNHNTKDINMVRDSFYTFLMKNPKHNLGLRSKNKIVIENENYLLDYLCSDFARFCLSLYKNNQHNDTGELKIVPKIPIPISKELKEYIESFLPDYYDIRTNRK